MELMQASRQWATRPADQRFLSLLEMRDYMHRQREASRQAVIPSNKIDFEPIDNNRGLQVILPKDGGIASPTHWSFGQLTQLVGAGSATDLFRNKLPAPLVADDLNYLFHYGRETEDVGTLVTTLDGTTELRAATGPNYGRVWNDHMLDALIDKFGDGVSGDFRVPGEFGKEVEITRDNTTIYGSDRDMFIFLADEKNRIDVSDRRDGKADSLARGFFVFNSETGKSSLGAAFFLFDYACCNRIVWGARDFNEIRIRHSSGAPDRWLEEIKPVLIEYANSSANPVIAAIESAKLRRIDDIDKFLGERFGKTLVGEIKEIHETEEHRPIETLWDATTAITARARLIPFQDKRVDMEREGGKVLQLAA